MYFSLIANLKLTKNIFPKLNTSILYKIICYNWPSHYQNVLSYLAIKIFVQTIKLIVSHIFNVLNYFMDFFHILYSNIFLLNNLVRGLFFIIYIFLQLDLKLGYILQSKKYIIFTFLRSLSLYF